MHPFGIVVSAVVIVAIEHSMDTVPVADSSVDDIEFVGDEHNQMLEHNHLLNGS